MTCSCATNVQAAFILGIIGMVFHLILIGILAGIMSEILTGILTGILWYGGITVGIVYALISAILVYGAYARNRAAILIWIIFAILECIGALLILIIISHLGDSEFHGNKTNFVLSFILLTVGIMIFESCSISVAKKARKEIVGISKQTQHHRKLQRKVRQAWERNSYIENRTVVTVNSISVAKRARKEIQEINKQTGHHGKVQREVSQATPYGKGPPILKTESTCKLQ